MSGDRNLGAGEFTLAVACAPDGAATMILHHSGATVSMRLTAAYRRTLIAALAGADELAANFWKGAPDGETQIQR